MNILSMDNEDFRKINKDMFYGSVCNEIKKYRLRWICLFVIGREWF